jgi:hypothetical protein
MRSLFRLTTITATPESILLSESSKRVQFFMCSQKEDYCGWRSPSRITIAPVQSILPPEGVPDDYAAFVAECAHKLLDSSAPPSFQHTIFYWPQVRPRHANSKYDEAAREIMRHADAAARPVFVVLNYATSSLEHNFGPAIYLNQYAQDRIGVERLVAAERKIFISKIECKQRRLQGSDKKPLRAGARVNVSPGGGGGGGGGGELTCVNKTMACGYEAGVGFQCTQDAMFLPRVRHYRVQTQLSLIEQAAKLSGVERDMLWIATIGGALMKAGKSIKTLHHKLAATAMVAVMDKPRFNALSFVELIQGLGRVTGRRREGEQVPTLYLDEELIPLWNDMTSFPEEFYPKLHKYCQQYPNMTIADLMSKHDYGETKVPSVENTLHGKKFSPDPMNTSFLLGPNAQLDFPLLDSHIEAMKTVQHWGHDERVMMIKAFMIARTPDVGLCQDDFTPSDMVSFKQVWREISRSLGPSGRYLIGNMEAAYVNMRDRLSNTARRSSDEPNEWVIWCDSDMIPTTDALVFVGMQDGEICFNVQDNSFPLIQRVCSCPQSDCCSARKSTHSGAAAAGGAPT